MTVMLRIDIKKTQKKNTFVEIFVNFSNATRIDDITKSRMIKFKFKFERRIIEIRD